MIATPLDDNIMRGPFGAAARGAMVLRLLPRAHLFLIAAALMLSLLMLPFGRSGPDDGGGLLAPLCADSALRELFRLRPGADFFSVYDAGARVLRGEDPYGVNADTGGPGVKAPYVATFRYIPFAALLAAPLALLPPWVAWGGWVLASWFMLVANFLLCAGRRPKLAWLFALIWFAWFPTIAELHMGQFSLFMATAMLWAVDGMASGRGRWGWGWFLAVAIKVYPIAMAPSLWLWGRRRLVLVTLLVLGGTTLAWRLAGPSGIGAALGERGVSGRLISGERLPYAPAMGVQEMVNAVVWKVRGRSFASTPTFEAPAFAADPVAWVNATVLFTFGMLCLWALVKTRRDHMNLGMLGLFWLSWFFAYRDCWEHHYMLFQALLGLLLARGVVTWRWALLLWVLAGGPSLWWLWYRMGYSGNAVAEFIGFLYFIQRPAAVALLTGLLVGALKRGSREK